MSTSDHPAGQRGAGVRVCEDRPLEVGVVEDGSLEVGSVEDGLLEVGVEEARILEFGVLKPRLAQIGTFQIKASAELGQRLAAAEHGQCSLDVRCPYL
jgi:hypothetical protein